MSIWKYRLAVCVLLTVQAIGILVLAEAAIRSQDIVCQEGC